MKLMKYYEFKDTNICIRIERVGSFLLFWCPFVTNYCFAFLRKKVVVICVGVGKKVSGSLNNKRTCYHLLHENIGYRF